MDLSAIAPGVGAMLDIVAGNGDGTFKNLGGLVGGFGGGQGGSKVSQNVQTTNNANSVLSNTLQISVSSPGGYVGPATSTPTNLLYPGSQSLSAPQTDSPASGYSSLLPTLNKGVATLAPSTLASTQGVGISTEMILIGVGAMVLLTMGGSKGKSKGE